MRRLRALLLVLVGAMALSGCSLIATSKSPVMIPNKSVGFELLNKTIPGTNGARVRFVTQPVYIVDAAGHLAPSSRIVPSPPALASVLRELILGPTDIESAAGYSSALPKNLVVLQATVKDGIGYVDITKSLTTLSPTREILAIGQIVLTAHDVDATKGVEITVDGQPQQLLLPSGRRAIIGSPADYRTLLNS